MNDERRTPCDFFDALNGVLHFDLDVAATPENALCKFYFTKEDDGIQEPWTVGAAWCNPPYSRGQLIKWLVKAADEAKARRCTIAMLMPGDCSTIAGQFALAYANAILFVNKRLRFDSGDVTEKASAKFCNWVALWNVTRAERKAIEDLHLGIVL